MFAGLCQNLYAGYAEALKKKKKEKKDAFFFKCHIGLAEKGWKEDILQFCQREELLKQKPLNIDRQQGYMLQAYSSPALFHNQH